MASRREVNLIMASPEKSPAAPCLNAGLTTSGMKDGATYPTKPDAEEALRREGYHPVAADLDGGTGLWAGPTPGELATVTAVIDGRWGVYLWPNEGG